MQITDNIKTSFGSILANKLRSILTMLGIIIGVASITLIASIGESGKAYVSTEINKLGPNMLVASWQGKASADNNDDSGRLTMDDVEAISHLYELNMTAPAINDATTIFYKSKDRPVMIVGTTEQYKSIKNLQIDKGRFFNSEEATSGAKVCIITSGLAQGLFHSANPVGQTLQIKDVSFTIIGVFTESLASMGGEDTKDSIIIPITGMYQLRYCGDNVDIIYAQAKDAIAIKSVKNKIIKLLEQRHNRHDEYAVFGMDQIQEAFSKILVALIFMFTLIAAISLVVGGIGIMNIMLVSVTERTKEIGIRMAIGAKRKDILTQFLIESVSLSVLGGIIGVIVSVIFLSIIKLAVSEYPIIFSVAAGIVSFIVSVLVGLVFGLYPANKASQLNPVDALRYE